MHNFHRLYLLKCFFYLFLFQISGGLYHSNVLWMQKLLFVPVWVSRIGRFILEPLFSSESNR